MDRTRAYDWAITSEPRVGTEVIYATHNYADRTTWFGQSVRVSAEVAVDDGAGTVWSLAHGFVIDLVHGKIFDEDQYVLDQQVENPSEPHGYAVVVRVDNVEMVMREPFASDGGDYEVNYADGKIVFFSSQAGKTVTVDYSYENGSTFFIRPDAGFAVDLEKAKAAWSADFEMRDTVRFEVYGYADVFAPELQLPPGTKIPIQLTRYKTLLQLVSEASGYSPSGIPAAGGSARGTSVAQHIVEFRYGTIRRLSSAAGVELRIRLENEISMGGEAAIATFYCVVRPE